MKMTTCKNKINLHLRVLLFSNHTSKLILKLDQVKGNFDKKLNERN